MRSSANNLSTIIHLIPLRKPPESFPDPDFRSKPIISFETCAVRVSDRNIARLHAHELSMAFEIIFFGQNPCTDKFLLQSGYVIQKVFRRAASDVVNSVGR